MSILRGTCLGLALTLLVGACAPATNADGARIRRNADVVVRQEILAADRGNLYEVLEMIRPNWLRARSEQSVTRSGGILIYLDEVRFGNLDSLRNIPARDIQEVRRYSATAASQRWGPGHSDGVIAVSTRVAL